MAEIILSEGQYLNLKKNVKNNILVEAKWYNTVLDILGIVDPTPTIDLINGFSYWKQGDYLYAFLSFLSAIPYGGDLIGKSAMTAAKVGGKSAKELKMAIDLMKTNPAKAAKLLQSLSKESGAIAKLINSSAKWGPEVLQGVSKFPKSVSGFSEFLTTTINFIIKNARGLKTAAKLAPSSPTKSASVASGGEEMLADVADDPLSNMFQALFSGKLNYA